MQCKFRSDSLVASSSHVKVAKTCNSIISVGALRTMKYTRNMTAREIVPHLFATILQIQSRLMYVGLTGSVRGAWYACCMLSLQREAADLIPVQTRQAGLQ